MKYNPRRDDDEVAYLVGGQWFYVLSEVQFLDGEHRFIARHPDIHHTEPMELHVQGEHIQAILWNVDQ